MSLRAKFCLSVVALVTFVVGAIAAMLVFTEKRVIEAEMNHNHVQMAKRLAQVAEESLLQNELIFFNYLRSLQNERGYVEACFVDKNGTILTHSIPQKNGTVYASPQQGDDRRDYSAPVSFGGVPAGTTHILFKESVLQSFVKDSLFKTLKRVGWISLIVLIVGLIGAFALSETLTKPIQVVVKGMQDVAAGKLEPVPAPQGGDETAWMLSELNKTIVKLQEVEKMKREITAAVTHELRSPLMPLERLTSLILENTYGPLSSGLREAILIIKNNTIRLTSFIDDLLAQAKLESKKEQLYCENFDLHAVVNDVLALYSPMAQEKKIKLSAPLPKTPISVYADRIKTQQVLANLLSNALKFTPAGSITVTAVDHANEVEVRVADTGPGISAEEKPKIFDSFYRTPETARNAKGTGLGLSIVKGFVELQQGRLSVQDNPGGGAIFIFTIPASSKGPGRARRA